MEHGSGVGPATEIGAQAEEAVRVLAGLQPGRIVNYVMRGGVIRPLLLVTVLDPTGVIAGVLFFDGTRDSNLFPQSLGQVVTKDAFTRTHVTQWVQAASFDDEGDLEGTWHWPSRQPVVASGIDAAVIETLRAELTASFNAKLVATVESMKEMLNDYDLKPRDVPPAHSAENLPPRLFLCVDKSGCRKEASLTTDDPQGLFCSDHKGGIARGDVTTPPLPTLAVPNLAEAKPDPEVVDVAKEAAGENATKAVGGSQG